MVLNLFVISTVSITYFVSVMRNCERDVISLIVKPVSPRKHNKNEVSNCIHCTFHGVRSSKTDDLILAGLGDVQSFIREYEVAN